MPDYSAGTASVRIRPNADDFIRDLTAKLRAAKDPGFSVKVEADVRPAARETDEFRSDQERRPVDIDVDAETAGATADMARWRAEQEANPVNVRVTVDHQSAGRDLRQLEQRLERLQRSDFLKINILGAGTLAAVGPATTGLAELAASLQQVAQAGLAVPGGIAAAAASIGTLVIGLGGISDAYKAVSKESQTAGQDQAAAAQRAEQASNSLRNAIVDEAQARKDVARATEDARQKLVDLNVEMRGGLISESRAILQAQQARERLASGKFTDVRDAILDVQEADQRLLEVRARNAETANDLADANKKGVANSDLVTAASERLTRASQQVSQAQSDVAEAAGKQTAAQRTAQIAMDQLSPNARKLVETLQEMTPAFFDLRAAASEPMLEGKAEEFKQFFNTVAPTLKSGLGQIGTAWNSNISALFGSLGSDNSKGLLDRIFGNTADAQTRMSAAIDPIVRAVGTLSAAGSDSLPRVADAITTISERFANFIEAADKDGRLAKWIDDGLTGMTRLGNTALNVGKSFTAITKAANSDGGRTFLEWLEQATGRMSTFLNSAEGQNKIKEFFEEGRRTAAEFKPFLEELPGLFGTARDAAQNYFGGILPLLTQVAELLNKHPDLIEAVATAYLGWKTIQPIVGGVSSALGLVSTSLSNLGTGFATTRDNAKRAMSDVDDAFVKAGKPSGSGLAKFSGALSALGGASGPLMLITTAAIPALMGALDKLNEKHREAAEVARQFEQDERTLEATLDRVTGKVTAATREQAIMSARDYNPNGPGSGIDGITKGNAVAAATSLGIAPDVYADALVGKPEAVAAVKDILIKNNLVPEVAANNALSQRLTDIRGATNNKLTNEDILNALLGDNAAVQKYGQAFDGTGIEYRSGKYSLADIAQMLAPTGRAAVLSGGALNRSLDALPGAQQGAIQQNQANYGRWRLTASGQGFFGGDYQVGSDGAKASVVIPGGSLIGMRGQLDQYGFEAVPNGDGSYTVKVPLNSPFLEKYEAGGPVNGSGPFPGGGKLAVVHPNEFVISARGRSTVPDSFLHQLNVGRFADGGQVIDENGNPVSPGVAPGPAPDAPIAPNPTSSGGGGLSGVLDSVLSGIGGPLGNAISLGSKLANSNASDATLGPDAMALRQSQVPGLIGLAGAMGLSNPDAQKAAVDKWQTNTLKWTANWAVGTLGKAASILGQGALGMVGLENSILSPSNPWNQAASRTADFALGSDGPVATLMGVGSSTDTTGLTDPSALAGQYGVTIDPKTGQLITNPMSTDATLTPEFLAALYQQHSGALNIQPGVLTDLPSRGGEGKLQIDTINAKRAIEAKFPEITEIGGYRQDSKKWHPNGLAIDVMIPGGDTHNGRNPDGKALGDRIYQFVMANKEALGVDYVLWQTDEGGNHYTHLHVNTVGGGYPKMAAGGPVSGPGGPKSDLIPAWLSNGEHVFTAEDVAAMGGQDNVYAFRKALHRAIGGSVVAPVGYVPPDPNRPIPVPPRPKPDFTPGPGVMIKQLPQPIMPKVQAPVVPPPTAPPAVASLPSQPAAETQQEAPQPVGPVAAAPSSLDHNLPAVSTAINSTAATVGNLVASAISAGGGGAGGGFGSGAAAQMVQGAIQQGGKIVEDAANVVSSFLVGNVPGSMGDPNLPAYGQTLRPKQDRPATAAYRAPGGDTNNFYGYEADEVMRMKDNHDSLKRQARLATVRG